MKTNLSKKSLIAIVFVFPACVMQSSVQGPVSQFSQATSTAVSAEDGFLDQVNVVYEKAQSNENKLAYYRRSFKSENLRPPSPAIDPAARAAIDKSLGAIHLYGQALEALASDGVAGTLDQNSKNVASGLEGLDKSVLQPLTQPTASVPTPVLQPATVNLGVAGVDAIAKFVLGEIVAKDVKDAAGKMQEPLTKVVNLVEDINNIWSPVLKSIEEEDRQSVDLMLSANEKSAHPSLAIYDEFVPDYLQVATTNADPAKINAALQGMLKANQAIASATPGGTLAAVEAFVQQATAAYQFYQSLPTK